MKKLLMVLLAVLVAVVIFVFGFRMGRLYSSNPMHLQYDPVERFNGRNLKVELVQARNIHTNIVVCTDGQNWFRARPDNSCYLADARLDQLTH